MTGVQESYRSRTHHKTGRLPRSRPWFVGSVFVAVQIQHEDFAIVVGPQLAHPALKVATLKTVRNI